MNRKQRVRIGVVIMAVLALMISLTSCAGTSGTPTTAPTTAAAATAAAATTAATAEPQPTGPVEITLMFRDHGDWPFLEDNMVNGAVEERLGIKLHYNVLPTDDYETKMNAVLASGELADITVLQAGMANKYGGNYFINLLDYEDQIPNIMAQAQSQALWYASCSDIDGNVWGMPIIQVYLLRWGLVFRGDLLEEYSLKEPATTDEFKTLLETLKEKDDAYYFGVQPNYITLICLFKPMFGLMPESVYKDYGDGVYVHDSKTTNLQKMLIYLADLYENKLLDQEFLTRTSESWEEELAKGTMVGFTGYAARSDSMTATTLAGTDMWLTCLSPLAGPDGDKGVGINSSVNSGYLDCVSKKSENIDACLSYMDYLMSDEGCLLYNWGIEGETYTVVNGVKKLMDEALVTDFNLQAAAGIQAPMYVRRQDQEFYETYTLQKQSLAAWNKYKDVALNPLPLMIYTEDESEEMADYDIATVFNDFIYGCVTGKYDPITDWGQFQMDMDNAGLEDYMRIVNTAYARYQEKHG